MSGEHNDIITKNKNQVVVNRTHLWKKIIFIFFSIFFCLIKENWMKHFFPGSPYYYSATSRGAGPAATATASAYDRHWPLLLREEEDEGGRAGGTDSTSTAQYKPAYAWTTMRMKISNFWRQWSLNFLWLTLKPTNALLGGDTDKTVWVLHYCEDTGKAVSLTDRYWSEGFGNLDPPIIYQGLVSQSCF